MREIIKLGLILLIITSVAAFVLGMTNSATYDIIQERLERENIERIKALLPEADEFARVEDENLKLDSIVEVYEGRRNGEVVGYTIKTNPVGYNARVEVIVGISIDGEITGVKIGQHSETPGLGSKIADASFVKQFVRKKANIGFITINNPPMEDKQIEAITSATISSDAVVDGVNRAGELFEILKNR